MSRRPSLPLRAWLLAGLALTSALGGALAQSVPADIDVEAIRARTAQQAGDAEALAATARARAQALATSAAKTAQDGHANGARLSAAARTHAGRTGDAFDFDGMVADAGTMAKADLSEAPRFIAFASTSMPPAALKAMLDDVPRAGGVVVFRGLTRGSAQAMTAALSRVLAPGERRDGVGIDPRLFRAFGIEAVPAYVVASSDFDLCDGFDCTTSVPTFDRISGNVTAAYALDTIAGGGGPGAKLAAQYRARLEEHAP
ncbi:type-F conjugative transfer system pilin assembly protein TrbC [Novosphingobium sp. PASSN1]|uniref:type-F conjugative transfer system pilin assembly protein TrbC n=1 Tax=Novosphingobium sp. PASSN1 TaxID=2015561 RepID=UPI0025FAF5C1|nr:type-F conjugative transfer system pilin assembly protein TrbC [Novosphingobium sp. PASSN1]